MTAGSMLANILGYLLHIAATNLLGPAGYGQFAALMAVQVVASVPALAVQTVVARERATGTAVAGARRLVWHTGGVVSVVALLVGLALTAYFAHWSGWVTLSALLAVPVLVGLAGSRASCRASNALRRWLRWWRWRGSARWGRRCWCCGELARWGGRLWRRR
ncbi:MAG: hypothetical protein U1U88_001590 [Lawsonella clevelandensis]